MSLRQLVLLLFFCQTVNSAKPRITVQQALELISSMRGECLNNPLKLHKESGTDGKVFCPVDFDIFWNCWPQTEAGTSLDFGCSYFQFNEGKITRRCFPNGTWESSTKLTFKSCTLLDTPEFLRRRSETIEKYGIIPIDPCTVSNGGCQHICNTEDYNYRCTCQHGYVLEQDGKSCRELQDSESEKTCPTDSGICYHFVHKKLKPRPDGNYAWPGNDHCFVQCVHGTPYCQCCNPKHLFFNEKCNQCMHKQDQECPKSTPSTITKELEKSSCTTEKASQICNETYKKTGNFPAESQSEYITCVPWKAEFRGLCRKCPQSLVWDEMNSRCDRIKVVHAMKL